eukprot:433700_1
MTGIKRKTFSENGAENKQNTYRNSDSNGGILHMKITQTNAIIEQAKAENRRLHKTLQVTNNELTANRKLMDASRPLNGTQTEQQLFQLEQDYLNLSKTLVACEHRVDKMKNELDEKQHELNEFNRLIDEQNSNKRMEEYKTEMAMLQANLQENTSDQSDLIEALQQEWEQYKEEVMRYKQKYRQLQHEKDEWMARNMHNKLYDCFDSVFKCAVEAPDFAIYLFYEFIFAL